MYVCINVCIYNIYKVSVSPGSVQQMMLYYLLLLLQRQSSHLTSVCLTSAKFKPLIFPLPSNGSWPFLYSLGTDRKENTVAKSSIGARVCCGHYLATAVVYRAST
jgi:hypothetical protein